MPPPRKDSVIASVSVIADSKADPQSQNSCNNDEITKSNAPHSPCNDIENAMQNPGVGCSGTLPRNDKFSSRFTLHSSLKQTYRPNVLSSYRLKKSAFTLAEVLITLGIIGVVAAITMPALFAKYQKQLMVNQLKAAYSILYNALNLAQQEYGDYRYWTYYQDDKGVQGSSYEFVNTYLKPYIKNVELYNGSNNIKGCKNITYRNMDRSIADCSSVSGFCEICSSALPLTQIHLANGMIMIALVRQNKNVTTGETIPKAEFFIDSNGLKGPNIWGKDIFRFSLSYSGGQYSASNSGSNTMKLCGGDCHSRDFNLKEQCTMTSAYGCAEVIIGDSWQIKDDYPWK